MIVRRLVLALGLAVAACLAPVLPAHAARLPAVVAGARDCVVYVTRSGKRFHKPSCKVLRKSRNVRRLWQRDALAAGFTPCSVCGGSDCDPDLRRPAPAGARTGPAAADCPPEGNARSAAERALNRLKNRDTAPSPDQLDRSCTLAALLAPGEDANRWSARRGAQVEGWVIDVRQGPSETCNCGASGPDDLDAHVVLALEQGQVAPWRMVVAEVTPLWRRSMRARGRDWSLAGLRRLWLGRRVRVTGWLMFDGEHRGDSRNTAARGRGNARATAWEIHPITDILPAQ